jgi:hypothetical protein
MIPLSFWSLGFGPAGRWPSGTLRQPVTDGFDSNEDGQPDEYSGALWAFTLRIDVEG